MFNLPADCNAVDIGANDGGLLFIFYSSFYINLYCLWSIGDTSFNLANSVGGKVVAFEMGPTFELLKKNMR